MEVLFMCEYIHIKTCSSEISLICWLHVDITAEVSWEAKLLQRTGKGEFQSIQGPTWFREAPQKCRDPIKATVKVFSGFFSMWCELNIHWRQPAAQQLPPFHKGRHKTPCSKENLKNVVGPQYIFFSVRYTWCSYQYFIMETLLLP